MDAYALNQWMNERIAESEAVCERKRGDLIQVAFEQGRIDAYRKVFMKMVLPPDFVRPNGKPAPVPDNG